MGKSNITYHSLRLNMDNEQHQRIQKVLVDLNTDIHKSVNQFIINALDAYIGGLEGAELTNKEQERRQNDNSYISRSDLEHISREIKDEVKDEIIKLLGVAFTAGAVRTVPEGRYVEQEREMEEDMGTTDLVNKWG